jgi:malonyl-CoA O-methyltransferase
MPEREIDTVALRAQLRRLERRQNEHPDGPWLHGEVARRMGERLALIRLRPQRLVEWWGGFGASDAVLRAAYPQARRTVVEPDAAWAATTRRQRQAPWWSTRRWGTADTVLTEADDLAPAGHQLVWANMVLQAVVDPPSLLDRWQRTLEADGFVMFSCFGPDTVRGLHSIYQELGFGPPGIDFVDMHDLGDMLVHAGFADPVMDQERLTLTWSDPAALLAELRSLGGNLSPARRPGLRTPRWRRRLDAALERLRGPDGRLQLTFEVAYGHAFKAPPRARVAAQTTIGLDAMRDMVRRRQPGVSEDHGTGLK